MRKKMMVFLVIMVFLVRIAMQHSCYAQQNLVPNPSFETYVNCPDFAAQYYVYWPLPAYLNVPPWLNINGASPDYYNRCANTSGGDSIVMVPKPGRSEFDQPPYFHFQEPRTGDAFVGISVFEIGGDNTSREYIGLELTETMIPNGVYEINFYASLAEGYTSGYPIKELGCVLTSETLEGSPMNKLIIRNDMLYDETNVFFDDTIGWQLFKTYYQAQGGEKFLTIGSFKSFSDVTFYNYFNPGYGAYYLIDDVSVVFKTLGTTEIKTNQVQFKNPVQTHMNLKMGSLNLQRAECRSLDGKLQALFENFEDKNNISLDLTTLSAGSYFLYLETKEEKLNLKFYKQ